MPVPHDYDEEIEALQEEIEALQKQLEEQKQNAPYIGENGNWYVNGQDTGVPAQGPKGADGKDGKDGKDGTDGTDGKDGAKGDKGDPGGSKEQNAQNWWNNDFTSGKFFNASVTGMNVGVTGLSVSLTGMSSSATGSAISCYGMVATGSINSCEVDGTKESIGGCFTFGLGLLKKAKGAGAAAAGNDTKNNLNKIENNGIKLQQ